MGRGKIGGRSGVAKVALALRGRWRMTLDDPVRFCAASLVASVGEVPKVNAYSLDVSLLLLLSLIVDLRGTSLGRMCKPMR